MAVLALVLAGCSPSQPAARVSSSPSQAASSPPPSPIAGMPETTVDFSCRLPVVVNGGSGDGITYQGGFLSFPSAKLAQDPNGVMRWRAAEQDVATAATPVLYGIGGSPFFDLAASRWVPAPASSALPDGSAYAYTTADRTTNTFMVHVVRVASGSDRTFKISAPDLPQVGDYVASGVYLFQPSVLGGPGEGLWLLSPGTGLLAQPWVIHQLWTVRNGYAWVARLDPRDKTVWPAMEGPPADSLVRIDLATGAETVWFYQAGTYPWMIGLDSRNRPIVLLGVNGSNEVRLIDQPGSAGQLMYSGTGPTGAIQADGDRLWFGSKDGIYLFTPAHGMQKVYAFAGDPANASSIEPAGFCI